MEIELLSNTFTIEHNQIEFIFNRDKRTLLAVAIKGYDIETLSARMEADLLEIKNCTTKDGKPIKSSDLKLFPIELYTSVFALYFAEIQKQMLAKSDEIASDSIKKKNVTE